MTDRSRAQRLERARGRRRRTRLVLIVAVAIAGVAVVAAAAALSRGSSQEEADVPVTLASVPESTAPTSMDASSSIPIEVPVLTGMPISEAEMILKAAGLTLLRVPTPAGSSPEGVVLAQEPAAGERVTADTPIRLTYADTAAAAAGGASAATSAGSGYVVCIDPGHQAVADGSKEPVGPGASESKPKVTGGAVGVVTRQAEYDLVLTLSLKVKERLERYGVVVVMTRTTSAVNISNSQRADVANQAGADLFLRVHADSSTNADTRGISTLYPGGNDWVAPIEAESLEAAAVLHQQMLASTAAADRGVVKRSDLSGFNYCTVPAVLVETGFLSNPVDDRQLADPAYQDTLADAIARGVLEYLGVTGQ